MLMSVAFVAATVLPVSSHAAMKDCSHGAQKMAGATKMPCCDQHAKNDDKNPCRDHGPCKCVSGTCNSGLTTLLNHDLHDSPLRLASRQSRFSHGDERSDSALPDRLTRPPRA